MAANKKEKELSSIEKISIIEENKMLKDYILKLEKRKENAKKTLKIYDDMETVSALTLLMDSLAEFYLYHWSIKKDMSRESIIELKILLAESLNEEAQDIMKEFISRKGQ